MKWKLGSIKPHLCAALQVLVKPRVSARGRNLRRLEGGEGKTDGLIRIGTKEVETVQTCRVGVGEKGRIGPSGDSVPKFRASVDKPTLAWCNH